MACAGRAEPWHQFPTPPAEVETVEDFTDRFVIIGGKFYDRLKREYISSVDELGTLIALVPFPKPKDAKSLTPPCGTIKRGKGTTVHERVVHAGRA
jgi:hypothetical protein